MLDLLLPRRCVVCGASGPLACERCLERLTRIRPPLCDRCGAPTAWPVRRCSECSGRRLAFASARAAVAHDEAARALVGAWKHRSLRRLAGTAAGVVAEAVEPPDGAVRHPGAGRPRAGARARAPPGRGARARARRALGAPVRAAPDPPPRPPAARPLARGPAAERGHDDRDRRTRADPRRPRRRRLHDRRDRLGRRLGAPPRGRPPTSTWSRSPGRSAARGFG